MKNLLVFLVIIFFISACKKDKSNSYTIKGQFVSCANGIEVPQLKNEAIDLFQQKNSSNNNSKVLANTNTDNQGNFSFTFETTNSYDKLMIRASSGFGFKRYIEGLPIKDISNLKIYTPSSYNLVVGLNVVKPYTNNDTLRIVNLKTYSTIRIAGPFVTGIVYSATQVPLRIVSNGTNFGLYYGKNDESQAYLFNNSNELLYKDFIIDNSKLCGDTVYVNIDIR